MPARPVVWTHGPWTAERPQPEEKKTSASGGRDLNPRPSRKRTARCALLSRPLFLAELPRMPRRKPAHTEYAVSGRVTPSAVADRPRGCGKKANTGARPEAWGHRQRAGLGESIEHQNGISSSSISSGPASMRDWMRS